MNLAALIKGLPVRLSEGSGDVQVTSIVEDSRLVMPGSLFVARPGMVDDGRRFIEQAIAAGAVAILTDQQPHVGVATLLADDVALAAAVLAERFVGHPSRSLKLVGITGTNGKTTTAHLVHHILNTASRRCGLIGTVLIDDGNALFEANLTTPPALTLSPLMRTMVDHGCAACVMETSSHALQQQRTAGLAFDVGVFTNISGDHLDYHESMDDYIAAKARLFAQLDESGFAIINTDDAAAAAMIRATRAQVLTCRLQNCAATCSAMINHEAINAVDVTMLGPWGEFEVNLPLCGQHNVMNALQAAAVGHVLGMDAASLARALACCSAPPGRLEPVTSAADPFAVYVDYAHTDDALENVLAALRPLVPVGGKLRVVFGCGGDRDRTKRPRMAKVACRYADEIIITSDNPRTEDPQAIVDEVHSGVPIDKLQQTVCIVDRRRAIATAIEQARENDVVLIAGKGHETYQIIGKQRHDFDDRAVAAEALSAKPKRRVVQQ